MAHSTSFWLLKRPWQMLLLLGMFCVASSTVVAEVRLPGFFTDHMVLQQGTDIRVWGWADVGESVQVTLGEETGQAKADDDGRWELMLPPQSANSTGQVLEVKGSNTLRVTDILIGEVWLCSGQSNMEWTVRISKDAKQEIAAADYPLIRHMKVAHRPSTKPMDDISSNWQICSPETVGNFTAVGYFMARKLHEELKVPIGLVNSSWGGTRVEPWTPPVGFAEVDALQDIHRSVTDRSPESESYKAKLSGHIRATEEWLASASKAIEAGSEVEPNPGYPTELLPFKSHQDPTMLYNGMIHALVGFPIRGAIWYQGESNHTEGMMYFEKKKALINGWRKLWNQGDFPFYYVQIAPFKYNDPDPATLAEFWEAQAAVKQLPNTEMVVINDIATLSDIHPPNKQDVGLRLAAIALKNDYDRDGFIASSPEFDSLEIQGGSLKVKFKNTAGGLKTRDGKAASHFEVIGLNSGGFEEATASVDGDTVELRSSKVKSPVAFRFAWHALAEPNLVGGSGLPVGACRGGKVPQFLDTIPDISDYELIYDLDLRKGVAYSVDKSKSAPDFDRVGYLLELESSKFGKQSVFVSANAFTQDATKIGIPTAESGASFQQKIEGMRVYSDVAGLASGDQANAGNIEFWPNNYGPGNAMSVQGASDEAYDFGDETAEPVNGYGSMQIHKTAERQTVFAINHWKQGDRADVGIGNSDGANPDWTFSRNAGSYTKRRLRVFVRRTTPDQSSLKPIRRGDQPTSASATARGPFEVKVVRESDGLRNGPEYKGATIYYPEDAIAPFASVLIVPGYVAPEKAIEKWGPFYASHGIVAMTIGTNMPKDDVRKRATALLDAKETLLAEHTRAGSPLEGKLDANRIGISGWSMGGGGAELAAVRDSSFRAVVALCPWSPGADFDHEVPVLIFGGSVDKLAPFRKNGLVHYKNTPDATPKLMVEFKDKGHWVANGPRGTRKDRGIDDVGRLSVSWLKVFLEGDERYREFLFEKPETASQFETNLQVK